MQHALKGFLHDTLNAFSSLSPPPLLFFAPFFGHSVAISGITLAAVVVVVTAAATVNFWALLLHFCHFVAALGSRQARFIFPSLSLSLSHSSHFTSPAVRACVCAAMQRRLFISNCSFVFGLCYAYVMFAHILYFHMYAACIMFARFAAVPPVAVRVYVCVCACRSYNQSGRPQM